MDGRHLERGPAGGDLLDPSRGRFHKPVIELDGRLRSGAVAEVHEQHYGSEGAAGL
jgi:hypothetical protein